jgi:glycosyltransferase involved in cell wall biosynthesis
LTEAAGRRIPDLVLAADLNAGLVASRSDLKRPLVYYHHDFFWKIRDLREGGSGGSWRGRWGLWVQRKAEERLVQSVDTCITGSTLELEELKSIGAKAVARIPPVATSEPVTIPRSAPQPCRIVHLGGLRTTATFLGLQRFLDAVWPIIRKQLPDVDFWVVGDVSIGDREMMARLKEAGAVVTGFVRDLSEVLRPGDLHVIPWEFATGVRTRVLSCFLHGQALVAIRAGVAGYEGLEDGKQCVLVDHLEELCDPLIKLAFDPERRLELAKAGRKYLKQRLTVDSVIPQFNRMMLQAVRTKQHNMDLR